MNYLLVGNYGTGNLGDEALKDYFLKTFPEVNWRVVSARPQPSEYPRLPCGLRSLFSPWWKTLGALIKSDGMVLGGGSLFTDAESVQACYIWWWHICFARLFGKKVILAFQGIGPFRTSLGAFFARSSVRSAASISVRDEESFERVKAWLTPADRSPEGVGSNKKIVQSFDPVFSLIQSGKSDIQDGNILVIIPRNNSSVSFIEKANKLIDSGKWNEVVILSLKPDDPEEQKVCESLDGKIVPIRKLSDLESEIKKASFVLSQRYHGALVALALGKEFEVVEQEVGDKLSQLESFKGKTDRCMELIKEGEVELRKAIMV